MKLNVLKPTPALKACTCLPASRSSLVAAHGRSVRPVFVPRASEPASTSAPTADFAKSREDSWKLAVERQVSGEVCEYVIRGFNKGGLTIKLGEAKGFVPYAYLNPSRYPGGKVPAADVLETIASSLVGSRLRLRVMRVDVPARDLVLSERAILMDEAIRSFKKGDVKDVVVKSTTDFGAFVTVLDAEGKATGVDGLIRKGDLSWNRVNDTADAVRVGQRLSVKVLSVDQEKKKINFSLKAMTKDPLYETLDEVLPMDPGSMGWRTAQEPLEGLDLICKELLAEQGITGVTLGRQAEERKAVSQDLELYLTNQKVEDGYNLVARAGMLVQEVHVSTRLSREDMKAAIQRALKKF